MKKLHFYGIAFLAGILVVIGIRATNAQPSAAPPTANVTPTFSGLNVEDGLVVDDDPVEFSSETGRYTSLVRLFVQGVSSFTGAATFNEGATVKSGLSIDGAALQFDNGGYIGGTTDIRGVIQNNNTDKPVVVNDNLKVTGSLDAGMFNFNDTNIMNFAKVTQGGTTTGAVSVIGGVTATGAIHANDYISTDNWLQTDKYLAVGEDAQIDGDLRVKGKIKNDLAASTPVTFSDIDGVKIEATGVTGVTELDVEGDLKADTIGSYGEKISGKVVIPAGGNGTATTTACDSKGVIISCGMKAHYWSDKDSKYYPSANAFLVRRMYADPSTQKCEVIAKNDYKDPRYLEAVALCFYPNL